MNAVMSTSREIIGAENLTMLGEVRSRVSYFDELRVV